MTMLKWDQPSDQAYEAGLDRGVIYLESGEAVAWSGLTSVDDDGSADVKEFYIDGIKYLSVVSARDWKGRIVAYTFPEEFAELIGIAEMADGLYADSQMPGRFGLSYRTLVGSSEIGQEPHYKIHLIYGCMASLGGFTHETIGDGSIDPTSFEFDLTAVPQRIPGRRPTAHIIIDTRRMDTVTRGVIEGILYGNAVNEPYLPPASDLVDLLNFGDTVIITDNLDGTWTATGSNANVYMLDNDFFQIDNVEATFLSEWIYEFGESDELRILVVTDEDGIPYFTEASGPSGVALDDDGVPYFEQWANAVDLQLDEDGVPWFEPSS